MAILVKLSLDVITSLPKLASRQSGSLCLIVNHQSQGRNFRKKPGGRKLPRSFGETLIMVLFLITFFACFHIVSRATRPWVALPQSITSLIDLPISQAYGGIFSIDLESLK